MVWTKPLWEEPVENFTTQVFGERLSLAYVRDQANLLYDSFTGNDTDNEQSQTKALELDQPENQTFSIGNVEIGDNREEIENNYGEPARETANEYGLEWASYHENYQNFLLVAYDQQDTVQGLYTNQDLVAAQNDITLGTTKSQVHEELGEAENAIIHRGFNMQTNDDGEYDVYRIDGNYITIFYDVHENDEVTAMQIVEESLETDKNSPYADASEDLKEGFEYQLFDVTNAERAKRGLNVLDWNEEVRGTARKHSTDMADNHYFDHTNQQGQSPFDRMQEDGIAFMSAGENLAQGQPSSIYAHQGLMNSEGHRKNIVNDGFTELGVGVDFNEDNQPVYTENFLSR
ncbi:MULTISPECIES: CAP domain-containing protein [Tetragenococcus]|uniref:CAP domain-containing protein n=1 Tax=Tetragenococcus osmophilus TaxID=526944 RepID=A0AA37XLN4_9ENTE|nr:MULTISPECIES: CAP domain-containing protein [Tetragenococcus]GBD63411.1 putative uncharacterized protein [Tetragenococcus halophilus subsp. flandriensis]GMA53495.1 CAP domain-containing protein [Alicyclobacillus contaminans]GMA72561.1 CAP domain-containing protein [Tetragenococcus osmophilus]